MAETLPSFNRVLPPLLLKVTEPPAEQTALGLVGDPVVIGPDQFTRYRDPLYNWQDMPHGSPEEYTARAAMWNKQLAEVKQYVVHRGRRWKLVASMAPGRLEIDYKVRIEVSRSDKSKRDETFENTIKLELGLELGGQPPAAPEGGEVPPVPPAARLFKDDGAPFKASFSEEFKHSLEISHETENGFSQEREEDRKQEFFDNYVYQYWQMEDALFVNRVLKSNPVEVKDPAIRPTGRLARTTEAVFWDNLQFKPNPPYDPSTAMSIPDAKDPSTPLKGQP